MNASRAAIVGVGEVPSGRFPDRSEIEAAVLSSAQALRSAGLGSNEIDAVITVGALASSQFNVDLVFSRIVEELGMLRSAKMNLQVMSGGATSATALLVAEGLLASGAAKRILIVHADKIGSLPPQRAVDLFSTTGVDAEWELPYGHNMNAVGALVSQRYMHETGTTAEQFAEVCVSLREWARLNPNAMFRDELTVEQVLSAKMVADPLTSRMCNQLVDGASALIVTSASEATSFVAEPAYVRGHGSSVTHYALSQDVDLARLGFEEAAAEAYRQSGIRPEDIQLAGIYDAYPVFALIALDGLKLTGGAPAGEFVASGATRPGGSLPMTTNGGMLSQGHSGVGGGMAVLVETARQLLGQAGERQVPDLVNAVKTASGGTWMDSHVTVLSKEA